MMRTFQTELGGRPLILETGHSREQANGSVLVRYGDTVVLVTATMSKEPRPGIDFFPLLVDYEERMYSIGKIPRVWLRREGRPTQTATLTARMIDRPLRPLFPDGFRHDVQVVATVLSVERDNQPDIAALIGASAALTISDIPFDGPVGGVQVGRVNGEFVINPTAEQASRATWTWWWPGTRDAVMMVESAARGAARIRHAGRDHVRPRGNKAPRRVPDGDAARRWASRKPTCPWNRWTKISSRGSEPGRRSYPGRGAPAKTSWGARTRWLRCGTS